MKPLFARAAARLHHDPEPTHDGYRLIVTRPDGSTTNSRVACGLEAVEQARAMSPDAVARVVCVTTGMTVYEHDRLPQHAHHNERRMPPGFVSAGDPR